MKALTSLFFILAITCSIATQAQEQAISKPSILLGHRYSGGHEPHGYEQYEYVGLFKKGNKYFMKPTKIKIETSFDKCSGDSIFSAQALNEGECIYLFSELKKYPKEAVKNHNIVPESKRFIGSKNKYSFTYNNQRYSLIGEGKVQNAQTTKDYKLILVNESKKTQQKLIEEELIENSKIEILFIGDFDDDGKPDFIINAPPQKDTRNIMLFLSSFGEGKELVNCVSQQFDWFDC